MKTFLFLVKSPPPSSPFPAQLEATGKSNEQNRLFSGSSQSSRGTVSRGRARGAPERSLNSRESAKTPRQGLAGVGRTARAPWLSRPRRALSTQKRSGRKRHCSTEAEECMLVWETNRPGSSCGLPGARWERPAQGRVKRAAQRRRGLRGRRNQERGRGCRHKQRAELSCQPLVTMGRMAGEPVWAGGAKSAAPDLSSAGNG